MDVATQVFEFECTNLCVRDSVPICILITGVSNSISVSIFLTRVGHSETIVLKRKTVIVKGDYKRENLNQIQL